MTLREVEKLYVDSLSKLYGLDEAKSLAWLSISFVCKLNRSDYLSRKNEPVSLLNEKSLSTILDELKSGKPLQYILGETEFYELTFKVNSSVLIPRPETEELVDWILKDPVVNTNPNLRILDIGTGSGCIPIVLKKNLPKAEVLAIDISTEALNTAIGNAAINKADVGFYLDDILNPKESKIIENKYSVIVSNPPYITLSEKSLMHQNVLDFEPHTALFVSDSDPLVFYKAIANFAASHLLQNGLLFLEINENLGEATVELLTKSGFKNIQLRTDLRGKDRMIRAERE
jgi:release factor glutamine methyltransferase